MRDTVPRAEYVSRSRGGAQQAERRRPVSVTLRRRPIVRARFLRRSAARYTSGRCETVRTNQPLLSVPSTWTTKYMVLQF